MTVRRDAKPGQMVRTGYRKKSEKIICKKISEKISLKQNVSEVKEIVPSLSRDLNTGPADYKSAALPTKPLSAILF